MKTSDNGKAESFRPIFIVGNSRSGTTMMGRILGREKMIFTFNELHFFEQLWVPGNGKEDTTRHSLHEMANRLLSVQRNGFLAQGDPEKFRSEGLEILNLKGLVAQSYTDVFRNFLIYESNNAGRCIPCDQTPRNNFYLKEILESYPNARIINMVRDPRDVLLSQKNKWKRRQLGASRIPKREAIRAWINYHPLTISKLWNSSIHAANNFKEHEQVKTVFFEQLLKEPQKIIAEICLFVDIKFTSELLNVPQIGSSTTKDHNNVTGINCKNQGKWKQGGLNNTEIFLCQLITGQCLNLMGYHKQNIATKINPIHLAWYCLTLPCQITLALLFNLSRTKNIWSTIKRRLS